MRIVEPQQSKLRVCLYGTPKSGKTRLATSLPWDDPSFWGEKWLYVAWDPGSESLASVRRDDRMHLVVVQPTGKPDGKGGLLFDPHTEAHVIASHDWAAQGISGVIWDTVTEMSEQLLRAYANTAIFSGDKGDKHITVGSQKDGSHMALPMVGDYGAAQGAMLQVINLLFSQPLHLIVIAHGDISQPDPGVSENTFGGPASVGQKGISRLAGKFDNLFRMEKRPARPPAKGTEYRVHTEGKGIWLGGMRTPDKRNPMPEMLVGSSEQDIDGMNFWKRIKEIQYGA